MQHGPFSLLLLLLLICVSCSLSLGASVRGRDWGARLSQKRCAINRQRIMAAAKHYYRAFYETKIILLKLKVHRQQLVEKQLRYQMYLQRLRIRHKARIQRQILRLKSKVEKTRTVLKMKLDSVARRYHLPVRQISRSKPKELNKPINKLANVLLSPLRRIRLGAKKSIDDNIRELKRSQDGMQREMHRILTFRYRIYRILRHQRVLSGRVQRLKARKRMARRLVAALKAKRQGLVQRLQRSRRIKSGQSRLRRFAHKIARCTRRIGKLRGKQVRLQMRITRTLSRQRRLRRRIAVIRKRELRKLQEGRATHARASRLLAKWNVYGPKQLGEILRGGTDPKKATLGFTAKPLLMVGPKSRAEVVRIMKKVSRLMQTFRKLVRKCLLSIHQEAQINKRIPKLERQSSMLSHKVQSAKENVRPILRQRIAEIAARLMHLKAKAAALRRNKAPLFSELHRTGLSYRTTLQKYKLHDFLRTLLDGLHESVRVKTSMRRSQQRRMLLAKAQKRLLRKVNKARGIPSRTVRRLVKHLARRIRRYQRRSVAKRVTKRLRRIERRLDLEARKAARIEQRKRHVRRRRERLRRREKRIAARMRRLKQRIFAAEIKRRRLLGRVNRLKSGRQAVLKLPNDGKKELRIRRINAWIQRAAEKIVKSTSRIRTLKNRRRELKIRMRRNAAKQRRLQERLVATRLRGRVQAKELRRQMRKKRKLLIRLVRKRLVSRRVAVRYLKQNKQGLVQRFSARKVLKASSHKRSSQTLFRVFRRTLHSASSSAFTEKAAWKKLLRFSNAEQAAEGILRSRIPAPLRKLSLLHYHLKERLTSLNIVLAQMRPAFKRLVRQEQMRQREFEKAVKIRIAKSMLLIKHKYLRKLAQLMRKPSYPYVPESGRYSA